MIPKKKVRSQNEIIQIKQYELIIILTITYLPDSIQTLLLLYINMTQIVYDWSRLYCTLSFNLGINTICLCVF